MHKRVNDIRPVYCKRSGELYRRQDRKRARARAGGVLRRGILVYLLSFVLAGLSVWGLTPRIRTYAIAEEAAPEEPLNYETIQKVNEMLAAQMEREFAVETEAADPAEEISGGEDAQKDRCDILVAIDPGHGGEDEGCSREQVLEKDINLNIAKALDVRLRELGYRTMLIRSGDEDVTLEERAERANTAGADIFVSLHQNACEKKTSGITGIEVWYNEGKADTGSERLARLIHSDLLLYSGAKDRGVIADESLYVIRETNMPACLVETGFLSNRDEREKLIQEEYQGRLAEAIASGIDLYFFPKTMYLTFDDGPTRENTDAILDILKAYDIKATFFLIGESVEKYPDAAKRIAEEGHTIGIHCYNHNYSNLYKSVESYVEDFEKARKVVYDTTGVDVKLFRFPGGSINSHNKLVYRDIIEEMTGRGYVYFDWNASLEDASKHNEPERLLKNAKDSTFGRRKVVMLAHDTVDNTVQCLEKLIEQFPEYRMEPLTEEVEPVQF